MRWYWGLTVTITSILIVLSWSTTGAASEPGDATTDLGPGEAGFKLHDPPSRAPQHAEAIEIAEVYLFDGLVNHDVEATRAVLADDAQRTELGFNTGMSGDEIAEGLAGDAFLVISGINNLRWFVECNRDEVCHAFSIYDLEINAFGERPPVLIAERFKVVDGLIEEIEAIFVIQEEFGLCSAACWPDGELGH